MADGNLEGAKDLATYSQLQPKCPLMTMSWQRLVMTSCEATFREVVLDSVTR